MANAGACDLLLSLKWLSGKPATPVVCHAADGD
jgi:hypothetical protein